MNDIAKLKECARQYRKKLGTKKESLTKNQVALAKLVNKYGNDAVAIAADISVATLQVYLHSKRQTINNENLMMATEILAKHYRD